MENGTGPGQSDLLSDPLPLLHGDLVPPESVLVVRGERVDDNGDGKGHYEDAQERAKPAGHLIQ